MSNMLQTKQEITSPEKKLNQASTEFKKFFLLQFTSIIIVGYNVFTNIFIIEFVLYPLQEEFLPEKPSMPFS